MTLHEKPPNATHWSVRSLAKAAGISYSSVQRIWSAHGLKPHLVETFKVSRDKSFAAKVEDVVGLFSIRPTRRWSSASTKRAKSKPSTVPNRGAMKTIAAIVATVLGGCTSGSQQAALQEPGVAPETPATVRADQIAGRWGVASYQDPKDRTRVEAAAKAQCKLPYVITAGASDGVVMHLADEAAPQDLRLKGSPSGKNYIGPPGPAGGEKDREVVSVDSRLLITRFVDPDAAKRYGYMVYVRCT